MLVPCSCCTIGAFKIHGHSGMGDRLTRGHQVSKQLGFGSTSHKISRTQLPGPRIPCLTVFAYDIELPSTATRMSSGSTVLLFTCSMHVGDLPGSFMWGSRSTTMALLRDEICVRP